jgi:hypothetical protein
LRDIADRLELAGDRHSSGMAEGQQAGLEQAFDHPRSTVE